MGSVKPGREQRGKERRHLRQMTLLGARGLCTSRRHEGMSLVLLNGTRSKSMAPHSSTLAWNIPGTGEPGGLPSMG